MERSYFVHSFWVSEAIIVINELSDIFARIPPSQKSILATLPRSPPQARPRRGGLSAKRERVTRKNETE